MSSTAARCLVALPALVRASVFAVLALAACEKPVTSSVHESEILNGTPSNRPEVVLFASDEDTVACSGTLIAPDVVLTAAHCLDDIERAYFGYSLAGRRLDPDAAASARSYGIAERVAMPGWKEKGCPMVGVDVALVRLEQAVPDVTPATLGERMPDDGEECVVVGYGRHKIDEDLDAAESNWTKYTTGEQRQARVHVQAADADAGLDAGSPIPAANAFAAMGIDGAHTKGDSGGPLLCAGQVTGVVSCSPDRDKPVLELVKIYASVAAGREFIDSTLARWKEVQDAGDAGNDAAGDVE